MYEGLDEVRTFEFSGGPTSGIVVFVASSWGAGAGPIGSRGEYRVSGIDVWWLYSGPMHDYEYSGTAGDPNHMSGCFRTVGSSSCLLWTAERRP
jgi:hypothetical protein